MPQEAPSATVVALTHDLRRKRSIASISWDNDPEKNVAVPVPFGCSLSDVQSEAEKAVRELSAETAALVINPAS